MADYSAEVLVLDEIRASIDDISKEIRKMNKELIKQREVKLFQGDYETVEGQINSYGTSIGAEPLQVSISTCTVDGEILTQAIVIYEWMEEK